MHRNMKDRFNNWIKELSWEDYALIGVMIVTLIIAGFYIAPLKTNPGPMYGGDVFYHMGILLHLERGGGFLANPQLLGEYPWNPYLFHEIANVIRLAFGLPFQTATLYMTFLAIVLAGIIGYATGRVLFKRKDLALLLASFLCFYALSAAYYKSFAIVTIYPLFLMFLYLAVTKRTWIYYMWSGLTLGIIGIMHLLGFMAFVVFTAVVLIYFYVIRFLHKEEGKRRFNKDLFWKHLSEDYWKIGMFVVITLSIALIFWFKPIFVFHLHTANNIAEYDSMDLKAKYFSYAIMMTKSLFLVNGDFSIAGMTSNAMKLLVLIFVVLYIFNKKKSDSSRYIMLMLITTLVLFFHYLITVPIIGKDFFGDSMGWHLYESAYLMAACMGLMFITSFLKDERTRKWTTIGIISIIIILAAINNRSMFENTYYQSAVKYDIPPYIKDVSTWLRTNTDVNDVIISTNEISFMVSSVSGDKVLTTRRSFSGMFVDVDRRWADAAVIMYGNNTVLRKELLDKYKVKYVYWQYNWFSMDYTLDEKGNLVNIFDPLLIKYTPEYEQYLKDNGVKYVRMNTWLDPAFRSEDYKTFDTLLVLPYNNSDSNPWNPQFTAMLKLDRSFYQDGMEAARIYSIQ